MPVKIFVVEGDRFKESALGSKWTSDEVFLSFSLPCLYVFDLLDFRNTVKKSEKQQNPMINYDT